VHAPSRPERRRYPRIRIDAVVSILRLDSREYEGRTLDLSLGGIRFRCVSLDLETGDVLRVRLRLGSQTVDPVGRVMRVVEQGPLVQEVALAFIELDPETSAVLAKHLPDAEDAEGGRS
jgi:hypothetical protein